jgi:hypothetical protein
VQRRIAALEVEADGGDVVAIVFVVDRIGLGPARDADVDFLV